MKRLFLKKWLIAFSVGSLLTYTVIHACGGWDYEWYEGYETNFTPETFVDQSYAPLFLSQDLFYDNSGLEPSSQFNEEIITDWAGFLNGKLTNEEVSFFLGDSSVTAVNGLHEYYAGKKHNPVSDKWLAKKEDTNVRAFVKFLFYAKQIETVSVTKDYWDYNPAERPVLTDEKLLTKLEDIYNNTQNKFLKSRYWFQMMKALFYSNERERAIAFFAKTEKTIPKNTLYYRAVSYIAGLEYKSRNYARSNYLYACVFDKSVAMRKSAVFGFHPQEEADWNQSLAMAKSNDEKCALWAIHGYYGDTEKAISTIYGLNPKNDYLDFLLTRLVNQVEINAVKEFDGKSPGEIRKNGKAGLGASAVALVNKIAESGKTRKPYLWTIAAGYMETLSGNYKKADAYFDKTEKNMPKTPLASNQLRLLRFINNLSRLDKIDAKDEQSLQPDLHWLYVELPKENMDKFRFEYASGWSKKFLSSLYKVQENPVMAEVFSRDANFYDTESNLQAMKVFLAKEKMSAFEKTALVAYDVTLEDVFEFQAVNATFEDKIPEAIAFMQQTGELQKEFFYGNPFNGNIMDCHDCDHGSYQKKKYSQLDFLLTIKEMQEKMGKLEDTYTNCMLLGNAFYNITHFGNGRIFYEGKIMGYGATPFDFRETSEATVTDCTLAKMYYSKALAAAKTNEQKAKCQYMLAKCERNDFYNGKYAAVKSRWDIEGDETNFLEWDGFKSLKNDYPNTKFYQEVLRECGYFRTYVSQSR